MGTSSCRQVQSLSNAVPDTTGTTLSRTLNAQFAQLVNSALTTTVSVTLSWLARPATTLTSKGQSNAHCAQPALNAPVPARLPVLAAMESTHSEAPAPAQPAQPVMNALQPHQRLRSARLEPGPAPASQRARSASLDKSALSLDLPLETPALVEPMEPTTMLAHRLANWPSARSARQDTSAPTPTKHLSLANQDITRILKVLALACNALLIRRVHSQIQSLMIALRRITTPTLGLRRAQPSMRPNLASV